MDLEFSIVLFENEGYATARGNKGVQDILAAKAPIPLFSPCTHIAGNGGAAQNRRSSSFP